MNFSRRYPLNVPGKFYINDQCTDCDLCRESAPDNITRDDRIGHSYVYKQPENEEEIALVQEGVEGCPTGGVGEDGDRFDWTSEPIMDWNEHMQRWDHKVRFDLEVPVVSYEEILAEDRAAMRKWRTENTPSLWRRLFAKIKK